MIAFKNHLILLIIFIYQIAGKRKPQYVYKTGIVGNITCKYGEGYSAFLAITTKPLISSSKLFISVKNAVYDKKFFIKGSIKRKARPILYLQIRHICLPKKSKCLKIVAIRIPRISIYRKGARVRFWRPKRLELSEINKRSREICY